MDEVKTENKPHPSPGPNGRRVDGVEAAELDATVAHLRTMNEQLRTALGTRIVIEQAKGILAERLGLSIDGAFALLRRAHERAAPRSALSRRRWSRTTGGRQRSSCP